MTATASRARPGRGLRERAAALGGARWAPAAGLVGLMAASMWLLRSAHLDVGFWIDEGLSVGIADRPLTDIPGVLRQDGSPPLYYMLLHVWMRVLGDHSEEATHALSLVLALAAIPVAWWLMRTLAGLRAAWIAAALVAANPFLTAYAQETRMYSLVILLGLVACATFAAAFALSLPGRRWPAGFAVSLAALLYTHNWAIFFGAAAAAAWIGLVATAPAAQRRGLRNRGLLAFGAAALAYAPWVPSLLFQAAYTGAPWARQPGFDALRAVPAYLLGHAAQYVLLVVAGAGLMALARRRGPEARAAAAWAALALVTVVLAWAASHAESAWATRYLAVGLPPLLLLAAAGLARAAGGLGLAALAVVLALNAGETGPDEKSNVRAVAASLNLALAPGDLVVSTQPEQAPVLRYYLETEGLRFATLTGPLTDLGVTDWRDGVERLEATSPDRHLAPLLSNLRPGRRVVLVEPEIKDLRRWSAPWTALVRVRSEEWRAFLLNDPRFRVVAIRPESPLPVHPNPVRATTFIRVGLR